MNKFSHFLIRIPIVSGQTTKEADNFFADLHRQLLSHKGPNNEKLVSFEIVFVNRFVHFIISCPPEIEDLVIGQIYAHFPGAELEKTQDYIQQYSDNLSLAAALIRMENKDLYPFKTYPLIDTDPLVSLSGIFSKASEGESIFIQILLLPIKEDAFQEFYRYFKRILRITAEPTGGYQAMLNKFKKLYFKAKITVCCLGKKSEIVRGRLSQLTNYFDLFDNDPLNRFEIRKIITGKAALNLYVERELTKGFLLNTEEVASLFHLPGKNAPIANVLRVMSKKAESPEGLPKGEFLQDPSISAFALTNFRNQFVPFGIKRADRDRHMYLLGKTGVGKSKLLEILMLSDIFSGKGLAVLDPHGDLAEHILKYIPQKRIADVIYFNPADEEYPIGFNPLANVDKAFRQHVVAGFIGIFKKLFAFEWTPRLEHMLRFTVLALLDAKDATVVSIIKLLTNKKYRQEVILQIEDPVVKNFWTHEFASWNEKFDNEAIVPLLNKVGEFIASPLIRNCLGQAHSSFSIPEVMNKGKILIMNLSSGSLGEDNSALLGSMVVTQLQQAAMARARLSEEERKDFYLYVDEFQNFATSAFANILSEARKYRLCLTMAHQYIAQLSEEIKKTVFGNVGTIGIFRVGSEDASFLQTEFAPVFNQEDLQNLDSRSLCLKMSISGKTAPPFSCQTITLPEPEHDYSKEIIAYTRANYARPRKEVEKELDVFEKESISLPKEDVSTKSISSPTKISSEGIIFQADKKKKKEITDFEAPII